MKGAMKLCCSCNRVCGENGRWDHIAIPTNMTISHGFCLDCCENMYMPLPEMKKLLSINHG
jgi:hypothetical protein